MNLLYASTGVHSSIRMAYLGGEPMVEKIKHNRWRMVARTRPRKAWATQGRLTSRLENDQQLD